MLNKLIVLIITRIIEFVIVGISVFWVWDISVLSASSKTTLMISLIVAYCVYLGVTSINDYWEITRGEGEPMI